MKNMLPLAALVLAGVLIYTHRERLFGAPGVVTLPGLPNFGSGEKDVIRRSSAAARTGQELAALTGNEIFNEAGLAIGRLFNAFSSNDQKTDLVNNYQDPLGNWLARVIDAWNAALNEGKADINLREKVKQLLRAGAEEFYTIARLPRFSSSGPGGIATIRHVVENILIADMDRAALND